MTCGVFQLARNLTALILLPVLVTSANLAAQTHVVSPADLLREAVAASNARQHNLEKVNSFLSSPKTRKVLGTAGIDPSQLKTAVAALDNQELARLAARSERAQADFAAGRISDRDLLLILIGLAALIIIIVAAK